MYDPTTYLLLAAREQTERERLAAREVRARRVARLRGQPTNGVSRARSYRRLRERIAQAVTNVTGPSRPRNVSATSSRST